jgi:mRNA degradation ribonuclease J1/J2
LPFKASLARFQDLRLLCDELKPKAAVSAWTEAVSARTEASLAREQVASQAEEMQQRQLEFGQVIRERDQSRSQAAEAVSRAEVLGGQLAEATERLVGASARAGALAESLAVRAQARCWRPPSRWNPSARVAV